MKHYYENELTTIYNGDCLEVMDYLIEKGIKVDAIITDPPYGTTACSWDSVIPFDEMWDRLKLLRKEKTPTVLFGSEPFSSHLRMSNIKEYKYDWIWDKVSVSNPQLSKFQPLKNFEIISLFSEKAHNYFPQGLIKIKNPKKTKSKNSENETLNHIKRNENYIQEYTNFPKAITVFPRESNTIHPTQKPLELMKYIIETYTKKGDLILDFTAGSFTTCVAADQLGRRSIGIEQLQKYCDAGIKRLESLQMRLDI